MNFWTLDIAGTEQTLEDWLITGVTWDEVGLGLDVLTLTVAVRTFGTSPFTSGARAKLFLRPESTSHPGTPDFTTGTKHFDGVVMNESPSSSGNARVRRVIIHGPWEYLRRPYLQPWVDRSKLPYREVGTSTLVMLFANPDFGLPGVVNQLIDAATQIKNIVQWFIDIGAPIALDESAAWEPAGLYMPVMQKLDVTGETAIHECLQFAPQVTCRWNYAPANPTIRFFDPTDATELISNPAKSIAPGTYNVSQVNLTRRSDLVTSAVQINYHQVNVTDGIARMTDLDPALGTVDIYPAAAWDSGRRRMTDAYLLAGPLVQTVQLDGSQTSIVQATLDVEAVDWDAKAWWKTLKPDLIEYTDEDPGWTAQMKSWDFAGGTASTAVAAVNLETGESIAAATLFAAYPNRILPSGGGFAPWMKLDNGNFGSALRVRVVLHYTFERMDGTKGDDYTSVEFTATDLASGDYSAVSSYVAGEPIPTGLAQWVQEALGVERWEGSIPVVERELTRLFRVGDVVNVAGGDTAWASMNAIVQRVTFDLMNRRSTITVGFAPHLVLQQRIDFERLFRIRRVWVNPRAQQDPSLMGGTAPLELAEGSAYLAESPSTMPTMSKLQVTPAVGSTSYITHESAVGAEAVTIRNPTRVCSIPLATLKADATWREVAVCVDGVQKTMQVLGTLPY